MGAYVKIRPDKFLEAISEGDIDPMAQDELDLAPFELSEIDPNEGPILDETLDGVAEWKLQSELGPPKSHQKKTKVEEDYDENISEALRTFKESGKKEKLLFDTATESEFWFCVCFKTQGHKDEFLSKSGLEMFGDKFIDGHKLAIALDIKLELPIPKKLPPFKNQKTFAALVE
jgi:hypothetical protein